MLFIQQAVVYLFHFTLICYAYCFFLLQKEINLAVMWRNWNTDTLLVETENGTIALEKNLAVSFKNRCVAFTRSSYPLPGACPKEMKTYIHTKKLYRSV